MNEMIGQSDRIEMRRAIDHWKAKGLDFSRILAKPKVGPYHILALTYSRFSRPVAVSFSQASRPARTR
jgi:hypothetical protein